MPVCVEDDRNSNMLISSLPDLEMFPLRLPDVEPGGFDVDKLPVIVPSR